MNGSDTFLYFLKAVIFTVTFSREQPYKIYPKQQTDILYKKIHDHNPQGNPEIDIPISHANGDPSAGKPLDSLADHEPSAHSRCIGHQRVQHQRGQQLPGEQVRQRPGASAAGTIKSRQSLKYAEGQLPIQLRLQPEDENNRRQKRDHYPANDI